MSKDVTSVTTWARQVAKEWNYLYSQAGTIKIKNETEFKELILDSNDLWFVVFTDGV